MSKQQWGHGYYKGLEVGYNQGAVDGYNIAKKHEQKKTSEAFGKGAVIATTILTTIKLVGDIIKRKK